MTAPVATRPRRDIALAWAVLGLAVLLALGLAAQAQAAADSVTVRGFAYKNDGLVTMEAENGEAYVLLGQDLEAYDECDVQVSGVVVLDRNGTYRLTVKTIERIKLQEDDDPPPAGEAIQPSPVAPAPAKAPAGTS